MSDLVEQMGDVEEEMDEVRELIKEEVADLFNFPVQIDGVDYNPNANKASCTVKVAREGREEIEERFEGVSVGVGRNLNFTFEFDK